VGAIASAHVVWHFPWRVTQHALLHADVRLLALAAIVNFSSLFFKATAWYLILNTTERVRFMAVAEATLVGAAVNNLSISGVGEGARVRFLMTRGAVSLAPAVGSLVWTRLVEGLGLALFILAAPSFLSLPRQIHTAQVILGCSLVLTIVAARIPATRALFDVCRRAVPLRARQTLAPLLSTASVRRLPLPTSLALLNWSTQWATYHLVLHAVHVPVPWAASFTALLAANVGGALRLTPANVGVMQASMAIALLPFDVPPEHAVAAGFALQALQVLPVTVAGVAVAGRAGLAQMLKPRQTGLDAADAPEVKAVYSMREVQRYEE
jgi:uncharacterized membrane protein YbhN (UPF0104 family)